MLQARCAPLIAIAALAMTAPASPATETVKVAARDGGECGEVAVDAKHTVTGGCLTRIVNERPLTVRDRLTHLGLVPDAGCGLDATARIGTNAEGFLTEQFFSDCLTSCDDPVAAPHPNREWPIGRISALPGAAARLEMKVTICFRAPGAGEGSRGFTCTLELGLTPSGREWRLVADDVPCAESPLLGVSGSWITETKPDPDERELALEFVQTGG